MIDKIAVIGNGGGGKTTLSRSLASRYGLPITHVDSIQYLAEMKVRPKDETTAMLLEVASKERWIIDGFGSIDVMRARFEIADIVVFVDFPLWRHYWWCTKRQIKSATCARDFRFNWQATTPADFAQDNDRGKPKNAFITNILNYTPDGKVATLEDEEVNTITVNTGATSSTFCKASRRTTVSFKKISDARLLVDLRQAGQMNSTSAACVGAAKDALAGKNIGGGDLQGILTLQNMMFYADTTL